MLVNIIIIHNNEYNERSIDYNMLTQYPWVLYKTSNTGDELYYIQLYDSNNKNELATKIIQHDINGSIIFVKISRTNIVDINIMDVPELLEVNLMTYLDTMSVSSLSSDTHMDLQDGIETTKLTSLVKHVDQTTYDYNMYDDEEYYNYHTGYDSY